jgi:DNA-binding PadR family transcriptional regulator
MRRPGSAHRNLWSLTVLCLLRTRPMHPYEMQRLIREWHKDEFLDLKRGSLYHAIERLRRAGLIAAVETNREGRRPERTIYRLTERGEQEVCEWLRGLLAKPVREPSQFFAALSFLPLLSPENVLYELQQRVFALESEIAGLNAVLREMAPRIGRLVLIEVEYERAMREAEKAWVEALMEDLRTGKLAWDPKALRQHVAGIPDEDDVPP